MNLVTEHTMKEEELKNVLQLEHDVNTIKEIMDEYSKLVESKREPIEKVIENVAEIDASVEQSNISLYESIRQQIEYKKTKAILAGAGLVFLNVPIGLTYGINAFIASGVLSGLGAGYWVAKK
jgi:t-SNARE complex subunit (syntaxin)